MSAAAVSAGQQRVHLASELCRVHFVSLRFILPGLNGPRPLPVEPEITTQIVAAWTIGEELHRSDTGDRIVLARDCRQVHLLRRFGLENQRKLLRRRGWTIGAQNPQREGRS